MRLQTPVEVADAELGLHYVGLTGRKFAIVECDMEVPSVGRAIAGNVVGKASALVSEFVSHDEGHDGPTVPEALANLVIDVRDENKGEALGPRRWYGVEASAWVQFVDDVRGSGVPLRAARGPCRYW